MFGKRSDQQRTAEDRARAAAERAARRSGRALPPEAFQDAVRPPDVEPHEPVAPEPVEEAPHVVAAEAAEPEPTEPEPVEPASVEPEPEPVEPVAPAAPQSTMEFTPSFHTEEHAVPDGPPTDDEPRLVASRTLRPPAADEDVAYAGARVETSEHAAFEDETGEQPAPLGPRRAPAPPLPEGPPKRRPAPAAPRRRTPPPPRASRSGGGGWGRRLGAVLAVLVIAAVLYAAYETFQPFHGEGSGRVSVTVPPGADAGSIGDLLAANGVVDSARFFELSATIRGDRGKLRPGRYALRRGMSNGAAIDALTAVPKAGKAVATVALTLVEGPSRKENAPVVDKSKKVDGSYGRASGSKAVLRRIRSLGAPKGTKSAEGFLFPATYTLPVGASANRLVSEQLDAFEANFKKVDLRYAKRKRLTRYDVLIIASMIEREAQLARERPLVSAVIYNRLKQGMPLGIDATIRYYTDNWQRPIRQSELAADEPYNTRLNRGLPPTPIGNPGLASLKAAARPSRKSYLYYVRMPGKSGAHAFSSTDAKFERDVAKYQAARGGQ